MELPKRKQSRLNEYDYTQDGYYFITICTRDRKNLFWNANLGSDTRGSIEFLSMYGNIVLTALNNIPNIYENLELNKYVIMPNHVHMILVIKNKDGRLVIAPTISNVIKQFKWYVSKEIGFSAWQKSFYDHIIRNEEDYRNIWKYIDENPLKWELDKYYNF